MSYERQAVRLVSANGGTGLGALIDEMGFVPLGNVAKIDVAEGTNRGSAERTASVE